MFQLLRPIDCLPPSPPSPLQNAMPTRTELRCLWLPPPRLLGPVVLLLLRNDSFNNQWRQNLSPLRSEHCCFTIRSLNLWRWKWRRAQSVFLVVPAFMASRLAWLVVVSPSLNVRLSDSSACWLAGWRVTYTQGSLWSWREDVGLAALWRRPQCVAQFCGLVCLIREAHEAWPEQSCNIRNCIL